MEFHQPPLQRGKEGGIVGKGGAQGEHGRGMRIKGYEFVTRPRKNARTFRPGRVSSLGKADQNPALMFSNSWIIFSRNSDVTGVCASSVVVTGSTKAACCASSGISAIAAVLEWA